MFPLKEVLTPNKFNNAFVDFAVKDIRAFSIILVENNRTSITITEVAIILNFKISLLSLLSILPNNKNIILAAGQAGRMSSKNVTVIPSKSIPQGIGALITLNPGDDFITATVKMEESLSSVRTGEITRAVRDTIYNGMIIKEGELIGLSDGELKHTGTNIATVFEALLEEMIDGDGRLITLYCGESTGINEAEKLVEMTGGKFGNQEFEIQTGGQPVYDLIISVE